MAASVAPEYRTTSEPAVGLPPATPADVRLAVARIYGDALQVEGGTSPRYLVGDFNGDGSQDLAVAVHASPAGLRKLNDEMANWILEDPSKVFVPDSNKKVQQLPPAPLRPHVGPREALLVIVHGYGARGWREPSAHQSYLLCDPPMASMVSQKKEDAAAWNGSSPALPRLSGDLIRANRGGHAGFLFWTGGHYAWHQAKEGG